MIATEAENRDAIVKVVRDKCASETDDEYSYICGPGVLKNTKTVLVCGKYKLCILVSIVYISHEKKNSSKMGYVMCSHSRSIIAFIVCMRPRKKKSTSDNAEMVLTKTCPRTPFSVL